MSAPNIINVTSIVGKTVANTPSVNTATSLLSNAPSSNQLIKINNLFATNLDVANSVNCTISYNNAANGTGNSFPIISTASIPPNASLIVIDKSTSVYLEENTSITVTPASANKISFVASYEVLS